MKRKNINSTAIIFASSALVLLIIIVIGISLISHQKALRLKAEAELTKEKMKQELLQEQLNSKKNIEVQPQNQQNPTKVEVKTNLVTNYEKELIERMSTLENGLKPDLESGITSNMINATYTLLDSWDKELNTIYKLLMAELPETEKIKVKNSERTWISEMNTKAEESAAEVEGGTYEPLLRASTKADMTKERAIDLAKLYDKLHKQK